MGQDVESLKDEADRVSSKSGSVVIVKLIERLPHDEHLPLVSAVETGDDIEQC